MKTKTFWNGVKKETKDITELRMKINNEVHRLKADTMEKISGVLKFFRKFLVVDKVSTVPDELEVVESSQPEQTPAVR